MMRRKTILRALVFAALVLAKFPSFATASPQQQSRFIISQHDAADRGIVVDNDLYAATSILNTKRPGKAKTTGNGSILSGIDGLVRYWPHVAPLSVKERNPWFDDRLLYIYPFHHFW